MSIGKTGKRFDFQLGGRGFILARGQFKGRAWTRTGLADTPGRRSATDVKYGELPDEIDHPEVWEDWSGGYGHAYRRTGENTYHWSTGFDGRNERQLIHCQVPDSASKSATAALAYDVQRITIVPPLTTASSWRSWQSGVLFLGRKGWFRLTPLPGGAWGGVDPGTATQNNIYGRPALTASGVICPYLNASGNPYQELIAISGIVTTYNLPYLHMVKTTERTWIAVGGSGNLRPAVRSIIGDPTVTANLTATLPIGPEIYPINDLTNIDDQLVVGLPSGMYVGDQTGTFVNVMPWLENAASFENCRDLMPYAGGVLAPTAQGLWLYRSNGIEAVVQQVPINGGRSPIQGYPRALGNCGPWVYAGVWTGSASYLLATQDIGAPKPRWHSLQSWPGECIERIAFDGVTVGSSNGWGTIPQHTYLAMTSERAASYLCYMWPIPWSDANPLIASSVFSPNYIASARMDMGNVDFGAPATRKVYRSVEIYADMLLSGYRYADVYYDLDQSGSFALLGRAQSVPKNTLYFSSGEGSFVTGNSIELSLRSFTASPALTPIYRSLVLRGALLPGSADEITAVARIADGMTDRQGGPMPSAATMIEWLRAMSRANTPVTLEDLSGATAYVNVIPPIQEQETYQQGEDNPEIAATIKMAVLVFSTQLTIEGTPGRRFIGPPVGDA